MLQQFDTRDIALSPAAARLANIYFRKLAAQDRRDDLSGGQIWYAAASAAECLQIAHEDAVALREEGASRRDLQTVKMVGQTDSRFYVELVDGWLRETRLTA